MTTRISQDLLERLQTSTTELGDLMYDRIAKVDDDDMHAELIAQASACYSWFLLLVDALPEGARVMTMQLGTRMARCSDDVNETYWQQLKEMPEA